MNKLLKTLLLNLVLFFSFCVQAQNLVSPITINLPQNLPANTADWATAVPPVMIIAQTKMENGHINSLVAESKILVTIKSGGSKVCGTYNAQTAPESNFTVLVKNWSGAAVSNLLGQNCVLKAGTYELCVQFYSQGGATAARLLGEACKPFTIKGNEKETYSPPLNVMPVNNKAFTEKEINAPITFRWTPVLPKPKQAVTYKLQVWQITKGQNATQAMKANTPLVEKEVKDQTQAIVNDVQLKTPNSSYVWNVEASKVNQMGEVELLGMSEATSFTLKLSTCTCEALNCPKTVTYKNTITGVTNKVPSNILTPILLNCNVNYHFLDETICGTPLKGCEKIVKGEFRNAAGELVIQQTPFSSASFFNIVSSKPGRYSFIIKYYIDDVECSTYTIPIVVSCNNTPPSCCPAEVINNVWLRKANGTSVFTFDIINCTTLTLDISAIENNCNENLYLGSSMFCINNCDAEVIYTITNNTTNATITGTNTLMIPATLANGSYTLKIALKCRDNICKTCSFGIVKNCVPLIDCCKNAKQMPPKIVGGYDGRSNGIIDCVSQMPFRINEQNRNCKIPLTIKAASICDANKPDCIGKVEFTLKNSEGGLIQSATNIITIPTTLPDGDYNLEIDYYCGEKICTTYYKRIVKECKPIETVNCCKESKWFIEPALYTKSNKLILKLDINNPKIINISQGQNNCTIDLAVYGKWTCSNDATCSTSKVVYTLINTSTRVQIKTNNRIDIPNTLANGNYKLTIEAYCGDTICKVYTFQLNKDCPQTSACCVGGSWGDKTYQSNKGIVALPKTGDNLGIFKCDEIKRFKVCYNCAKECEPTEIKYTIYKAYSMVDISSVSTKSCKQVNITMPTAAGNYQMTINATCGGVQCTGLEYFFTIECPLIDTVDCCKNASYKAPIVMDANENRLGDFGTCDRPIVYAINTGYNNCNKDLLVKASSNCGNDTTNCRAKIVYTLSGSNTTTIVNTQILKIPASLPTGQYFLQIDYYCGNKICRSCKYEIKKQCPPVGDCCTNSNWEEMLEVFTGTKGEDDLTNRLPKCDSKLGDFNCKTTKEFQVCFSCAPNCGKAEIVYDIVQGREVISTKTVNSCDKVALNFPTIAGNYKLVISAKCNGKICKTCTYDFSINCKIDTADCCKNSSWEAKIYYPKGGEDAKIFPEDKVRSLGDFDCKKEMKFKVCFKCGTNCTATIDYKLFTSTGALQSSTLNTPSCTDIVLIAPNTNGVYVLMLYAKCNGKVCDSSRYFFRVNNCTPPPADCCKNGRWLKAQYEVANKKADGSWDLSDATLYNFSTNRVTTIPTYKADLGLSVKNLKYQCFDQQGCNAEYIISRKNLLTGETEPDELLTSGKDDAGVYSKPYPQLITIQPLCGGQKCDKAIEFYLECLNKDCVILCIENKILNLNTGIDDEGRALPTNTLDGKWSGHFTLPNAPNPSYTCKALIPELNKDNYSGQFSISRNFVVCKKGEYNLTGIFRCDHLQSIKLLDGFNNSVWTANGLPTRNNNFNIPYNANLPLNLNTGQHKLVITYSTRLIDSAGYAYPIGFSFCGQISTQNGGVSNTREGCCSQNQSTTYDGKTIGNSSSTVKAEIQDMPNNMGIGWKPTEPIKVVQKNGKEIIYKDLTEVEAKNIKSLKIIYMIPSSFTVRSDDKKNVGEENINMSWYWKIYKESNGILIGVPMTLLLSDNGLAGLGGAMRKNSNGNGGTQPACKFKFRNLPIDKGPPLELFEDDELPEPCFITQYITINPSTSNSDITELPLNLSLVSKGVTTIIKTKHVSQPSSAAEAKVNMQFIAGYGAVAYPLDYGIPNEQAEILIDGLFKGSKVKAGVTNIVKKQDYVGHVTLLR